MLYRTALVASKPETKLTETKLTVKCGQDELELWKEAAHVRRTTLSEWVRKVLSATATETVRKERT